MKAIIPTLQLFTCESILNSGPGFLPKSWIPARRRTALTGNEMADSAHYDSDSEWNNAEWEEAVSKREAWWYNLPEYQGDHQDLSHINTALGF